MTLEPRWIDMALLAVLAVSVLVGMWRGFVFEVVALLGWVVAFVVANVGAPVVVEHLPAGGGAGPRFWAAWGLTFFVVLVTCTLLARLMRALIAATPLSAVDRLLGAAFGVARGALILVVIGLLVSMSPVAQAPWWRQSQGALWLGAALEGLKPVLPQSLHLRTDT